LFISDSLSKLWGKGFCTIGDVTFESAAYVARYITKKINGPSAKAHYEHIDLDSGEVIDRKPEYITMSRRPGIAAGWYESFKDDVYPSDSVVIRGKERRPPKFYDSLYGSDSPEGLVAVKAAREERAQRFKKDCTPERLRVREQCKLLDSKKLLRSYEDDI
jgi:hypothetical protein